MSGLYGNATGGFGMPKTFVFVDENDNELNLTGVVVGEETVFTAGLDDIRAGKVAANAEGVVTGTKDIPAYRTRQGTYMICAGEEFTITPLSEYNAYDYTQLQCIIAPFNSTAKESVAFDKIVLGDKVYMANSSTVLSSVSKDHDNKSIKLNIVNDTDKDYVIHYFTYREEV